MGELEKDVVSLLQGTKLRGCVYRAAVGQAKTFLWAKGRDWELAWREADTWGWCGWKK